MTRHHLGRARAKANAITFLSGPSSTSFHSHLLRQQAPTDEPETLRKWAEFHEAVGWLLDVKRQAFDCSVRFRCRSSVSVT